MQKKVSQVLEKKYSFFTVCSLHGLPIGFITFKNASEWLPSLGWWIINKFEDLSKQGSVPGKIIWVVHVFVQKGKPEFKFFQAPRLGYSLQNPAYLSLTPVYPAWVISIQSAIQSRETNEYFIPLVPWKIK